MSRTGVLFKPTLQTHPCNENRVPCNEKKQVFPCEKKFIGKTLFSLQGWICSENMIVKIIVVKEAK